MKNKDGIDILLGQKELHKLFYYRDGMLFQNTPDVNKWKKGRRVGSYTDKGYRTVLVGKKRHKEHQIIWKFIYGYIPDGYEIDHINRRRDDNRIENLRIVTRSENMRNVSPRNDNESGCNGVDFHKSTGKWRSRMKINGKSYWIGRFETKEQAIEARKQAEKEHGYNV